VHLIAEYVCAKNLTTVILPELTVKTRHIKDTKHWSLTFLRFGGSEKNRVALKRAVVIVLKFFDV